MKINGIEKIFHFIVYEGRKIEKAFIAMLLVFAICFPLVGVNYDLSKYLPQSAPSRQALSVMEDDLISEIQEMIDTSRPKPAPGKSSSKPVFDTLLPMLDPIADYILDNREICASMFQSRVGSSFFPKFRELVSKNGAELIKEKFPDYDREIYDYYIAFISFGIQGQLQHWFDTGLSFPKKDLIKMVDQIITAAAVSVLA